jgi:hypothetical protein
MTLPRAYIARHCPGEVRFKVPRCKGDAAFFQRVAESFGGLETVDSLEINPLTGSILLFHRSTPEELAGIAREQKLFALAAHPEAVPPATPNGGRERGQLDLRTASTLFVLALGLVQLARGRVLGPASSLLWIAWQIASLGPTAGGADDAG